METKSRIQDYFKRKNVQKTSSFIVQFRYKVNKHFKAARRY